jgi:hypothetical protein
MEYKEDRGTILQVTFDILYPNGQLKSVTMSLADTSEFKDVGMIVFDESLIKKYVLGTLDEKPASALEEKWNSKDVMIEEEGGGEAPFKPAMVLVEKGGKTITKCGGHRSSGHIGTGGGVQNYM